MKRILAISLVCLLTLTLLVGCGTGGGNNSTETSGSEQTWELNLGCIANNPTTSTGYNSIGKAILEFTELADEYTEGKVKITPHWSSVLGNNVQLYEQIMMGELDFHIGQPMSSADKRFAAWNVPFVFESLEEVKIGFNSETGVLFKLTSNWMEENGVKLLAVNTSVFRGVISQDPVYVPADMKKMKIRTYEDSLVNKFWGEIGTASIIAGSEIYSALQTKTVDAMEFHATGTMSFKLYEVAKYFTDLNWQWTNGATLTLPIELWESFPEEVQKALQRAADEMVERQYSYEIADQEQVFADLEEEGMTIIKPTDEQRQEWIELSRGMDDWFKDYVGSEAYDEYMAAVAENKAAMK
ncbi:hypothetical protein GC105_07570 [Alkalibaculum sp. M08DMB]|uniref:C4-dicarboxylate ABC transporter substrate-binding protein n=1 Tax=Alkalibaculum sporogenes TaxID=2655001 RepID=A0A6A7K8E0_9FIRM|nr:TRAP transporter substrate-binding protein [Alkalibaculum sporogenes]MPW25646.1 hypothetical protein [Alkalibaculum sporogenes]